MEALLRKSCRCCSSKKAAQHVWKRYLDLSSLPQPAPYVHQRLHPDWKQVDNKIRRMESRLADFRILCNDVRLQKIRLEQHNEPWPPTQIEKLVKEKEAEVVSERAAIITDLRQLTANFVEGAQREYVALRKFFLVFLYHTIRFAFESLSEADFHKLLTDNADGVSFEVPGRGTVSFSPRLSKMIWEGGKKLFVNPVGVDTSAISIAYAILQAPHHKHCTSPNCQREDCIAVKSDYEELFEAFFKETARSLGFQKARGDMSATYDVMLTLPAKEPEVKQPEPEPEPVNQKASWRIG